MKMLLAVVAIAIVLFGQTGCGPRTSGSLSSAPSPDRASATGANLSATPKTLDSVAVLPFSGQWNKPDVASDDWSEKVRSLLEVVIPDSLTKGLVENTAPNSLRIIATEVVRESQSREKSALATGKALNVATVLSGRLVKDGQLSVQLIAVDSGELLWGKTYQLNLSLNPTFPVTYRVAISTEDHADIIRNLILKLTGKEPPPPPTDKK
jgi:TolB-like protein